jgi:hypothetical protein
MAYIPHRCVAIRIDNALNAKLEAFCEATGRTAGDVMRALLRTATLTGLPEFAFTEEPETDPRGGRRKQVA